MEKGFFLECEDMPVEGPENYCVEGVLIDLKSSSLHYDITATYIAGAIIHLYHTNGDYEYVLNGGCFRIRDGVEEVIADLFQVSRNKENCLVLKSNFKDELRYLKHLMIYPIRGNHSDEYYRERARMAWQNRA